MTFRMSQSTDGCCRWQRLLLKHTLQTKYYQQEVEATFISDDFNQICKYCSKVLIQFTFIHSFMASRRHMTRCCVKVSSSSSFVHMWKEVVAENPSRHTVMISGHYYTKCKGQSRRIYRTFQSTSCFLLLTGFMEMLV